MKKPKGGRRGGGNQTLKSKHRITPWFFQTPQIEEEGGKQQHGTKGGTHTGK